MIPEHLEISLRDRVAMVTGAGSGIGRATAEVMAAAGAKIAVVDLNEERAHETARVIEDKGSEALALPADVSNARHMQDCCHQVEARWGQLDTVFANAGVNGVWAPIEDLEPEEWDHTMNVNLRGVFLTIKYAIPLLKRQGGSITITSSVSGTGLFNMTGASAYSSSKAALATFAKMAALELSGFGIRVNAICPGSFKTDIFSSTKMRNREKIAIRVDFPDRRIPLVIEDIQNPVYVGRLVAFLSSDQAAYITGAEIRIDGGQTLLGI